MPKMVELHRGHARTKHFSPPISYHLLSVIPLTFVFYASLHRHISAGHNAVCFY